ncbi:MAG: preprotein translocase subunit SecG [Thermodesulfobacteriota bacterium]
MQTLLIIIHVLVCLFLIVIVLLQHGKGADMGASFGGSSQTVFGTEGPLPLLNKITTGAAIVFMVTSVLLAYLSSSMGDGTVMQNIDAPAQSAPAPIPLPPAGEVPPVPAGGK